MIMKLNEIRLMLDTLEGCGHHEVSLVKNDSRDGQKSYVGAKIRVEVNDQNEAFLVIG